MALCYSTLLCYPPSSSSCSSPPTTPPCLPTSFLPSGLHSSGSSPFLRDGIVLLAGRRSKLERSKQPGRLAVQALFGLGVPELVVIAGVTALIFGPKKLPEIGKSLGKTVKSFQQAAKEFESEVKQGGDAVSVESSKPEATATTATTSIDTEKENTQV